MSRGQQGIGISAAGMYGVLTTGKPVKIISKISRRKPAHYFEIQIDTKSNQPEILNGKGEGVDIPPGEKGQQIHRPNMASSGCRSCRVTARGSRSSSKAASCAAAAASMNISNRRRSPIRTSRCTISIRKGTKRTYARSTTRASAGAEGDQAASVRRRAGPAGHDAEGHVSRDDLAVPDDVVLARQPGVAQQDLRDGQDQRRERTRNGSAGRKPMRCIRRSRTRRSAAPSTDCISPIGEELILKGCTRSCRASSTAPRRGRRPSIAAIRF